MLRVRVLIGANGVHSFETSLAEQGGSPSVKTIFHNELEFLDLIKSNSLLDSRELDLVHHKAIRAPQVGGEVVVTWMMSR